MATLVSSNGNGFMKVFFGVVAFLLLTLFSYLAFTNLSTGEQSSGTGVGGEVIAPVGGRGGLTQAEVLSTTIDFSDSEWIDFMNRDEARVAQFNVDVYIPSSHAALNHSAEVMNAALRTCSEYGTVAVISTNYSRRLTLLCEDPNTKRQFAVIIEKLKRSADAFKNTTSELVTAFELKVEGEWLNTNIAAYINSEVNIAKTGMLVRLAWKAGELFFSPYR